MNVTSVGSTPAPLPAPLPVQRLAPTQNAPDAGSREPSHHAAKLSRVNLDTGAKLDVYACPDDVSTLRPARLAWDAQVVTDGAGQAARPGQVRLGWAPTIGCDVVVGELAFLRDYIAADHEFAEQDGGFHQREAFFFCDLAPGAEPRFDGVGDVHQTGIAWIPLDGLDREPLWPKTVARWLATPPGDRPRYLGNVN